MTRFLSLLIILTLVSCKKDAPKSSSKTDENKISYNYPVPMSRIFAAHGGIQKWKGKRALRFEIPGEFLTERYTINLLSRKDRIDTNSFSMGFDGNEVWLLDPAQRYEGNAKFYHNLMFYFYGMPFILSDKGIVYSDTEDLIYEGKSYPGMRVSYDDGVGDSSKDEFYIYYDPSTNKMEWLGYTVTYFTGGESEDINWIHYDSWETVNGLTMPKSISWHEIEVGKPTTEVKNTIYFENAEFLNQPIEASFFEPPSGSESVY